MRTFPRRVLLTFVLTVLGGTLLHFVYDFFPNAITAVFSPVSESLWEHTKIIYWPYLIALLVLTRNGEYGGHAPWLLTLLILCAVMLAVGYCYHIVLGGESVAIDIAFYVLLIAAGFLLPRLLRPLAGKPLLTTTLWALVLALGVVLILFTRRPPHGMLVVDLSAVRTWITIPF